MIDIFCGQKPVGLLDCIPIYARYTDGEVRHALMMVDRGYSARASASATIEQEQFGDVDDR